MCCSIGIRAHEHGGQRSGASAARIDRPLFDADAADMPFGDKVFDYVICSHVLEHVERPDAVVAELARVAKAGYIEVPEASSAKIVDFPSHLWWVTLEDGVLVFTAKSQPYFDADIDRYLTASGMRQPLSDLLDKHLDHRVIELSWTGTVACRVVGSPPPDLVAAARAADAHHRGGETAAGRVLTTLLTVPLRRQKHREPIRYDDIVEPSLRTGTGEVLTKKIYRPQPRPYRPAARHQCLSKRKRDRSRFRLPKPAGCGEFREGLGHVEHHTFGVERDLVVGELQNHETGELQGVDAQRVSGHLVLRAMPAVAEELDDETARLRSDSRPARSEFGCGSELAASRVVGDQRCRGAREIAAPASCGRRGSVRRRQ